MFIFAIDKPLPNSAPHPQVLQPNYYMYSYKPLLMENVVHVLHKRIFRFLFKSNPHLSKSVLFHFKLMKLEAIDVDLTNDR